MAPAEFGRSPWCLPQPPSSASPTRAGGGSHALSVATALVPLYRIAETLLAAYWHKEFTPRVDLLEFPGLVHLALHRHGTGTQIGLVAVVLAALAAAYCALFLTVRALVRGFESRRLALPALAVAQLLATSAWLMPTLGPALRPGMFQAIAEDLGEFLGTHLRVPHRVAAQVAAQREAIAGLSTGLSRLQRADVFVLFLESYGRSGLQGDAGTRWRQRCAIWQAGIEARGGATASAWVRPSVAGGGSTLAHAELQTGIAVPDRVVFDLLLASDAHALARLFTEAGYETFDVQPGMPRAWPEAEFFGFAHHLFQPQLPYDGRAYHWGRMPDQVALAHLLAAADEAGPPVFAEFVSVTSHAPFSMVPPYLEDWSALEPGAFAGFPAAEYPLTITNYPRHSKLAAAYEDVIHYSLRTALGFLARRSRPYLAFVLGDHQPPIPTKLPRELARDVPIHAIASSKELLAPILKAGFVGGLAPDDAAEAFASAEFLVRFVRAYGP